MLIVFGNHVRKAVDLGSIEKNIHQHILEPADRMQLLEYRASILDQEVLFFMQPSRGSGSLEFWSGDRRCRGCFKAIQF
ncbi:MAG TPA: hypothetical protein VM123_16130 [archaeon]|nr:hypothetical protein [archaeon]